MIIQSNVAELRTGPKPPAEVEEHEAEYAPNGDPVLSPSQVSTFLMCPRKWAARYLHGQREPVAEGTLAGKRMHSILETYYKKGIVPSDTTPEGVWALALIAKGKLPIPAPTKKFPDGPVAERKFKFEHGGVWWRGSKDLTYMRDGLYVIRDHKSTSELNPEWIKTGDKLLTDPQSVIYAFEAFLVDDPDEIENEWGYVTRKKYPEVDVFPCRMTWDITARGMDYLTQVGLEMLRYYRERPALNDLAPVGTTTGGCEAFMGCKVVGCNVSALDRIRGQQLFNARKEGGRVDMGYLEDLRARQAGNAALTPGAASAPAAAPVAATAPATAPAPPPVDIRTRLASAPPPAEPASGVAPPPYTPPPPPAAPAAAPAVAAAPAPLDGPRRPRGRARAAAAAPTPAAAQVIDTVGQAVGQAAVQAVAPSTPTPAILPRAPEVHPPAAYSRDGFVLCVNCAPIGDPDVLFFSLYVQPVHVALKESKGWGHYNLASFEGKAAFQDALAQYLEQSPPVGYLYVDARTDEGRDALPTLERYAAGKPFRGF